MKKKFIVLLSIITSVILIGGIFVSAYFGFFYKIQGSEIVMENVKFTVNDNPNKSEENTIFLSNDDLSKTDGYQIVLNYSLNGTFVSNYAMEYNTYFQLDEDNSSVATALDLYRFDNGMYKYLGKLSDLAPLTSSLDEPEAIYSGYLGAMGTHKEKFLIVYPMGSIVDSSVNLKVKISTKSNITLTDVSQFPYYYLNDIGVSDDGSSAGRKAENLFISLSENSEEAETAKNRTVVLMRDITYSSKTDLVFNNMIGLDLNGYTLDLKGGSITFTDTNDVANSKTNIHPKCLFTDSKETGQVKGNIILNYKETLVDIDDSFMDALSRGSSTLNITNASLSVYKAILDSQLNEIAKEKHLTLNGSYNFDAFGNLKNYSSLFNVALTSSKLNDETTISFGSDKIVRIGNVTSNEVFSLIFKITKGTDEAVSSDTVELYGNSSYDCAEYLKSYIPKELNGSIYLPTYIEAFNAFITWISSDDEILSSTGELLKNGYKHLDNWYHSSVDLGFIVEQNDKVSNGIIKDIDIQILTEKERTNLIYSESNVVFASETADINKFSFSFIDLLAERYNARRSIDDALYSTEPVDLSIIADVFNVELDTTTLYQAQVDSLLSSIKTKLGLANIPYIVDVEQGSVYAVEEKDGSNVLSVSQNGIPSNLVVVAYELTFNFDNGGLSNVEVIKNKIISINAAIQVVSFVDLTNTLRVPFDAYTKYMTDYSVDGSGYYTYNPYINTFELVSSFNNTAIEYTVPDQYKDYVRVKTVNGRLLLEVAKDNVPADTHTVTISAKVEGFDDNIYLPFTCVGVLHNASSTNHAEFGDGKLYIELLNLYDINKDQLITDLEAKNSPITALQIVDKNITSLVGLKYFNNITSLSVHTNKIVNIDDVAYLTKLTSLNMNSNKIASLEPLRYLDNLRYLYVSGNQISTLEPIQHLTGLKKLYVDGNVITDFKYVEKMTNLTDLGVGNNKNSSGTLAVGLKYDSEGIGAYAYVIRGNQYYFNLLAYLRDTNTFNLYDDKDSNKTLSTISANAKKEAYYLSLIEPIYKTSDTISLPMTFTTEDGTVYPITYTTTSEYEDFLYFERVSSGPDLGKVVNITLRQLPVDKEVIVYANIIGFAENQELFYRPIKVYIRKSADDSRLFGSVEVSPNYWVKGTDLVKDSNLLAALWAIYDADNDGRITNTELKHTSSEVSLNLEDKGITSLSGIQYFGNITYINLRNNDLELNDPASGKDVTAANISYLAYLSNLKTLFLNRQYFDFDDLINYTRLKNGSNYQNTREETLTVNNAMLVDSTHSEDDLDNLFDKSVDINFAKVGLTTLTRLNVNGAQKLSEYETKTKLYHVYLVNKDTVINKDTASVNWEPIEDEISKILGNMTTSAKFINYNDKVEIKKTYYFYLFDDLYPTLFSLEYTALSEYQYLYSAVTNSNYGPTTNNTYKNVYLGNGSLYELSDIDSSFVNKTNHRLNSYFNITSNSENISIQYKKLTYRDYQAYLDMKISTSSLSNGRRKISSSRSFSLALLMQYNNDYVITDDSGIDSSVDGKPLNSVFGSTEAMLYVMNSLSDQLRLNNRNYYYRIVKNDGTVEKYYYNHNTSTSYIETDPGYVVDNDCYKVLTSELATYDGSFNGAGSYNTNKYFFIAGNFMPTASSAVDGLRFLPQIKKAYFKNDAVLGDGKDLVNLTELFICYSYFDIKDFNTVLTNMNYLTISQSAATNLSSEKDITSNPNDLIETYMVYFPNLIQFHFSGEGVEEKGQMYEWSAFLAYSYIPYNQIYKRDSNNDYVYYHTTGTGVNLKEYVGGMELDSDGLLYWYDKTIDEEHLYNNFKNLYYYNSNTSSYEPLDDDGNHLDLTISGNYYANIYINQTGTRLSSNLQIFRHVKKGTITLNNFKLSRGSSVYDSGVNKYSNTYENQLVLIEIFNNLDDNANETHFYIANEPHIDDGDSYDFDPNSEDIMFATTLTDEYNEIAPTVSDLHLKVSGYKFDGTDVTPNGVYVDYSSIDWSDTDYSDYYRQGMSVLLPLTLEDFKTGNMEYDKKYRTFTISWYLSFVSVANNSYYVRYTPQRIGYAVFDGNDITCYSENIPDTLFSKANSNNPDYVYEDKYIYMKLSYPGYYLFEGVLELSDGTNTYTFNTTYDPRQADTKASGESYTYTKEITGSVSVIYPITITSIENGVFSNQIVSSRLKSMTQLGNYLAQSPLLKWFDTIIDRSFKFVVFSNFAKTSLSQVDSTYDLNIGSKANTTNPFDADNDSRTRLFDKVLYSFYELDSYKNEYSSAFTSTNINDGIDTKGKSNFAVKTYAGLERFLSEIYTLDGWDKLKIVNFYYKYASNLTYLPINFPSTLRGLYVSSTYGITYYGGLFNSGVTDARLTYYSTGTPDAGVDSSDFSKYTYLNDNIFDIYDYPDLVSKINNNSSVTLPMSTLAINTISEESYKILAKLSQKLTSKVTIYLSQGRNDSYLYNFTDYATIKNFCDTVDTSKLDIIIDSDYKDGNFTGGSSLISILKTLVSDYNKVTSTNKLTSTHWYETTSALSSNVKVYSFSNSDKVSSFSFWSPGDGTDPDFYPDLSIMKNIQYNVAIRYTISDNKSVQILKALSSSQDSSETLTSYTYEIATFKTGVKTGTSLSYTASDLNFYQTSEFDSNFVKFLIYMTRTYNSARYGVQVSLNGYKVNAVKGPQLFGKYNTLTRTRESYMEGEDNSTDVQVVDGYVYILDKNIKINDMKYVIIVNTEYYNLDFYGDANVHGVISQGYNVLDLKGFELLPFKAVVQGNGVGSKKSNMYVTKITNSGTIKAGYTPKIQYIEINNKVYDEVYGVNLSGTESYNSMFTTICNVDNLAKSVTDRATLVIGDRAKILQRFLKYDSTNGITLINDQSKTIFVKLDYSKMHLLFNNYASTYNGTSYNFDTAYNTSFNYQLLKKEILNATMGEETIFFEDYHDYYTPMYYKLVNFAGGGLTNITMFNNLMNHPFYSEKRGVLGDDSSYNYYISKVSSNNAKILFSGAKYTPNKLFGTIMNVHSDNIRKLSNNKNISMYYESDKIEAIDDNYTYVLSDSVKIKLPKTINGTKVLYLPIETFYVTGELMYYGSNGSRTYKATPAYNTWVYYDQNYGYTQPSSNFANSIFDMFVIKEYSTYFEISLKPNHSYYTSMSYTFAAFEYNGSQFSGSGDDCLSYTLIEWFRKTKYSQAANYDVEFNANKGENFIIKKFYVDINTNAAIGRQTIKPTDPLYLPMNLSLVGTDYTLTYEVVDSTYASYVRFDEVEVHTDPLVPERVQKFYTLVLTDAAKNAKDVKIKATVQGIYYTYRSGKSVGGRDQTTFVSGQTYAATIDGSTWYGPITDYYTFYDYLDAGYHIRTYNENAQIAEPHEYEYTSFYFYVDLAADNNAAANETYPIQTSDFYAEVLVDTSTQEIVDGSLVEEYLDGSGNPISGYEYQIRRADTIFESGLLLTDIYYSSGISLGKDSYTRHDFVANGVNIDYFAKYAVVDVSEEATSLNDYRSIFVKDAGNLVLYSRNDTDSATTFAQTNSNYRLALVLTKEQIANIHYFSSTAINNSDNVTFRPQSSLEGLEIFPLTNVRIGFHNAYSPTYNGSKENSKAFSGNIFESLINMKLTEFTLVFKYTTIFIDDWSFLFNSRDTLTKFVYGGVYTGEYTGESETYGTSHDDFSFLLSFDNLEEVRILGLSGIQNTQNFKYLASTLYLKFGKNIVTYSYNNNNTSSITHDANIVKNTESDLAVAIPILYKFHSTESAMDNDLYIDSDFSYQNNYELYLGDGSSIYSNVKNYDDSSEETRLQTQYLLPSFINDSGTYYKLTYDSLSTFMDVVAVRISDGSEFTMLQYQALYQEYVFDCLKTGAEVSDYEFASGYHIYVRFNDLANCLTDRIMISAKIECESKMESKDGILAIDNSADIAKTNYTSGSGYSYEYFDGNTYIYTPYTYERYLSIYINHESY